MILRHKLVYIVSLIISVFLVSGCFSGQLLVTTDKQKYFRYEMVEIKAGFKEKPGLFFKKYSAKDKKVKAVFFYNGKTVESVGNLKELNLRYNEKENCWIKKWPIPWNPGLGKYTVKVIIEEKETKSDKVDAVPEELTPENKNTQDVSNNIVEGSAEFIITGRTPPKLPTGFCVFTLEGRPDLYPYKYPHPFGDKTTKSWENIVEWVKYIGADAIWSLVGQTQIWKRRNNKEYPWEPVALEMMEKISKRAKENGLLYGGWITSYVILGDNPWDSDYKFTVGYDPVTKQLKKTKFASVEDPKRKEDIIRLLQLMDKNPNVSYLGLDYVRTGFGGYEFVDSFVDEMSIKVPLDFHKISKEERMKWLGARISSRKEGSVYRRWEWWRGHKFAELIKSIIEESKIQKPLWIFTLGWEQGRQHGQDPLMFIDVGVSVNSIMLYHCTRPTFNEMMTDWSKYLDNGRSSYVIGECIDWALHQKTLEPAGPQEVFDRHQLATRTFYEKNKSLGLFWHDLSRGIMGNKGPYTTLEWVLAGGTSFSKFRSYVGRFPYITQIKVKDAVELETEIPVDIAIINRGDKPLNGMKVSLIETKGIEIIGIKERILDPIPVNANGVASFKLRIDKLRTATANRFMVACQIDSPDLQGKYNGFKKKCFDFKYVKIVPPKIEQQK